MPVDPNSPYASGSTVTVLSNTGTLAESGFTFAGWNTQSNGLGTSYAPGATFTITSATTLYAVFNAVAPPTTYSVTYNKGTATSGSVPVDPNSPYASGSTVTVLSNTGTLAESGFTFAGWNTQSNGLGTSYAPGATFTITSATTLYAVFNAVAPPTTYSVTYNKGTATSGSVPVDPNSPYASGSTVTVLSNTGTLAESGFTFAGWNTQSNGLGTSYAPGATFTITSATTLYAVFNAVAPPTTYSVTYNKGTATSGSVPVDPNSPYASGSTVTVLSNTGTLAESGFTFAGWNTQSNGLGTSYAPGATFTITSATTLYAVFNAVAPPTTYSVTYNKGTATSGSVPVDPNSPYASGSTVTVLSNTGTLAESGFTFAGWNTQSNGLGTSYAPGATFTITSATTLYAVFNAVAPPTTYSVTYNKGTATSGSVPVDPNSPYASGSTVTVLSNTGTLAESGFTFAGWNTQSNGLGTSYAPGATFTITSATTLYAVFNAVAPPTTYSVTYNKGTATSGSVPVDPNSPYASGSTVTVLSNTGTLARVVSPSPAGTPRATDWAPATPRAPPSRSPPQRRFTPSLTRWRLPPPTASPTTRAPPPRAAAR